ncbi:hypothetical protein [Streptomyces globisporus]|uniref:hypothetical protein n=1 Tax=Streptomyces globisporus TaxID=1908 RepID=UPI00373AF274
MEIAARPAEVERHLQDLVEANMESMLGVRFLASEYSTGPVHRGRIDSLGLDENGSPVVVEYKRGRDADLLTELLAEFMQVSDLAVEASLSPPWRHREIWQPCPFR